MSWRATLASTLAALAVGCGADRQGRTDQLAGVIKGLENPYFETMRDGMTQTARRHAVALRLGAAAGLQDTAGQASTLESLVGRGASCYIVNPINPTNLIEPLANLPSDTPIVNLDSPIDPRAAKAAGVEVTSYIGTDNLAAGRTAADAMARFVAPGARVAVITGIPGDVSSGARARGFIAGAAGRLNVVQSLAADYDAERARLAAAELLRRDARIGGVFAVNDEMALGVAAAVREAGRRGEVAVIGMDGIRASLDAVAGGELVATVAQYPYTIGRLGVEACLAATSGAPVPARIDAPVQVVTRGNVERAKAAFPRPVEPFDDPLG